MYSRRHILRLPLVAAALLALLPGVTVSCSDGILGQNIGAAWLSVRRHLGLTATGTAFVDLSEEKIARIGPGTEGVKGIYFSDFVEKRRNNHIRRAADFRETADTLLTDLDIPLSHISRYYGIEDGRIKAGRLDQFADSTVVLPVRNRDYGYISRIELVRDARRRGWLYVRNPLLIIKERRQMRKDLRTRIGQGQQAYIVARQRFSLPEDYDAALTVLSKLPGREADSLFRVMYDGALAEDALKPAAVREQLPFWSWYPPETGVVLYDTQGQPMEEPTVADAVGGKIFLADSLGNAAFVSRLIDFDEKFLDELNALLARHPMGPVIIDNGRYYRFDIEKGSYREYIRQDLYRPDSCLFVVGSLL